MVARRVRFGTLDSIFRGVYFAGHGPRSPLTRACAAVLACAPRALLSGRSSAAAWGLPVVPPDLIEVTVVGRQIDGPVGVRTRSIGAISPEEVRRLERIPITSPALTLLDLAGVASTPRLEAAHNEARVRRLVRNSDLRAALSAHPKRRGAKALARLLSDDSGDLATESEAEALCLRLMLEHDLRPDETQARIGRYRVDFLFRSARLIVEVDGFR